VGGNAPPAASTAQDDLNAELFFEFVEVKRLLLGCWPVLGCRCCLRCDAMRSLLLLPLRQLGGCSHSCLVHCARV
jgi:hypothetical protein